VTPTGTASEAGLTSAEAAALLARHGENVLPHARPPSAWKQVAGQLFHFFALLLWVAAGLAIVAGMPALGIAIALVVVINGSFAFAQERRAEHAASRLRALLPRRAVVRRDGAWQEIDASLLVVGDLVALAAGDRISADLEVRESRGLLIDASALTGESVPVSAGEGAEASAGTFVVEGEGVAMAAKRCAVRRACWSSTTRATSTARQEGIAWTRARRARRRTAGLPHLPLLPAEARDPSAHPIARRQKAERVAVLFEVAPVVFGRPAQIAKASEDERQLVRGVRRTDRRAAGRARQKQTARREDSTSVPLDRHRPRATVFAAHGEPAPA